VSVKWEDFSNGKNRRLNTNDKSQIILHEEFNTKKVIEEFVEDVNSNHNKIISLDI